MSFSDYSKELLKTGITEARFGDKNIARRYLDRAIYSTTSHEIMAEAWFWMSTVADDTAEKRKALENCLSHDLYHARARKALAILDGKLKADEVINPDSLPPAPEGLRGADAQRFMCPKCGGRMSFSPDGSSLVCDYCTRGQTLEAGPAETEKDFFIAMATLKGHGRPLQDQAFHCNGCGAEFILPPNLISASCAYCDSPHVVALENAKDLLAPDAIIPHAFDQRRAIELLIQWVNGNGIKPEKQVDLPRGLYLPLWTFDIGGQIDYTAERVETEDNPFSGRKQKVVRVSDQYPVMINDLPLPASRKPSSVFLKLIATFDLKALQPYDPRFLASWPAEIYDISMAEASLDARSQAYRDLKARMQSAMSGTRLIHTSSSKMVIESFKLNLLPVWMTEIPFDGREHLMLINGQSGAVASDIRDKTRGEDEEEKPGGLMEFLAGLLGEEN